MAMWYDPNKQFLMAWATTTPVRFLPFRAAVRLYRAPSHGGMIKKIIERFLHYHTKLMMCGSIQIIQVYIFEYSEHPYKHVARPLSKIIK